MSDDGGETRDESGAVSSSPLPRLSAPQRAWSVRARRIGLDRPVILGILNVTPDSFSDGGRFLSPTVALEHATRMIDEGADVIDIGGESTRPQGARPVDLDEELGRVLPVVRAVRAAHPTIPISVDTVKSAVARAAIDAGADIVNDVSALRLDPAMGEAIAATGAGVVLMHSRGGVSDMAAFAHATYGDDVTGEVIDELLAAAGRARTAGIQAERVVLDPGIGFAKQSQHSLRVLAELPRLAALGYPVLVGVSRKRFIGELSGVTNPQERLEGSVGANAMALALGAQLFRVHDVRATRRALDVGWAILASGGAAR